MKKGLYVLIGAGATLAVQYAWKKYGARVRKTWDDAVEKAKERINSEKKATDEGKDNGNNSGDNAGK